MKEIRLLKLKDICSDIFAGAALFTNNELFRDCADNGYRVIRTENAEYKKPKIKLKLSDIYNIKIPIVSAKIQNDIDKLSQEATECLRKSISKAEEIENLLKGY
ncbi:MAG: hypothetical protein LBL16_05515 [Endomicrobium sp.]|jgi:hypothetical protein|nr:hypothetical protein [Endomicrobium sp.]